MTVDPAFLKKYEKEETLCPEDILAGPTNGKSSCISVPPASNRLLGLWTFYWSFTKFIFFKNLSFI